MVLDLDGNPLETSNEVHDLPSDRIRVIDKTAERGCAPDETWCIKTRPN